MWKSFQRLFRRKSNEIVPIEFTNGVEIRWTRLFEESLDLKERYNNVK